MNFVNGYSEEAGTALTIDNVKKNESLRQFFKEMLNKLLGKFGQGEKTSSKFIRHAQELEDLFYNPNIELKDFFTIVDNEILQAIYQKKTDLSPVSRKTNVTLAAFITSSARIEMDLAFRKLEAFGAVILYTGMEIFYIFY